MDARVLVPLDDSDTSRRAIDYILAQHQRFSAPLTLLHVVDVDRLAYRMIGDMHIAMISERARKAGAQLLQELAAHFHEAGVPVETRIELGNPREVIPRVANTEGFELLIISRSQLGEIRDVLFGSVANHVMHRVKCPVLLV